MYIYNVTLNVDESIHAAWLLWMEDHILEVLNTGKFSAAKFTEVLVDEEMGGKTYSVQYSANSKEDIENYYQEDADLLRKKGFAKFGDKVLAFRTELRLIKEFYPTNTKN